MKKRVQLVRQSEHAECGLACVLMLANHLGHSIDLQSARRLYVPSVRGSTLPQLISLASSLQLSARPLRVELSALGSLRLPAILHWDFNHFVVLESWNGREATVCDPASGRLMLPASEVSRRFTGVAVELSRATDFQPQRAGARLPMSALFGHLRHVAGEIPKLVSFILAMEAAALAMPLLLRLIIDSTTHPGDRLYTVLPVLALAYAGFLLASAAASFVRSVLVLRIANGLMVPGAGAVFRHLLNLPFSFFESRLKSDIASRFDSLGSIHRTLSARVFDSTLDGILAILLVGALSFVDVHIAMIVLLAGVSIVVLQLAAAERIRARTTDALNAAAEQSGEFLESLRCIQTIQVFGLQALRGSRLVNAIVKAANARTREQVATVVLTLAQRVVLGLALLGVIWVAAPQVGNAGWTLGVLILVITYATQALTRVERFVTVLDDLRLVGVHKDRLADILMTPADHDQASAEVADPTDLSIQVRNLWFRHSPHEPWILQGLNLDVAQGECVAVVGPSGCGKSTLMKLLLGLLQPTKGEIRIGGILLQDLGKERLRKLCASVLQDDKLFYGSVAENISLFEPNASLDSIAACATIVGMHNEISKMPMQYHTILGNGTAGLSGGQVQRILLARALYAQPKLLLLDEATSHLDVANEIQINERVSSLSITRILIAHRPDTIKSANRCIDLPSAQKPASGGNSLREAA